MCTARIYEIARYYDSPKGGPGALERLGPTLALQVVNMKRRISASQGLMVISG
ncbi:hypothetical protein BC835DRAFT_1343700 [Cytidiella melzeri]|nr:hypothetical protein BC835DRAFT_1343700 [Cytidiella melzeri]